ncbi:MAG TPA: DUF6766 family protein [Microbacteriaceae bacterium]|nr:DUF6766 family protein [Microbacteriaceae bacterium]
MTMARIRDQGLTILFLTLFAGAITGQAFAGLAQENADLAMHGQPPLVFWDFVTSSAFLVDVAENWQSEFLQFFVFIAATVWLVQRGSSESKLPGKEGLGSDREQLLGRHAETSSPAWAKVRGLRRILYSNSLLLAMGTIFVLSWLAQSLAGVVVANDDRAAHGLQSIDWGAYVLSPDFWNRTLQNWQSEFLAVGTMIAFAIYLRQRGSPESKPVGMPHDVTAAES